MLSNLTIECVRFDWFWWGDGDPLHFNVKRRNEISKSVKSETQPPAGKIQRVLISNVIARGQGSSVCVGHPDNWLEDVTIDHFKLYLTADPKAPYETVKNALEFRRVHNLKLRNIDIYWDETAVGPGASALVLEDIKGLELDGFNGRQANPRSKAAAVVMNRVEDALVRNGQAPIGTQTFLRLMGTSCKEIVLFGNDVRKAKAFWLSDEALPVGTVRAVANILPEDSQEAASSRRQ